MTLKSLQSVRELHGYIGNGSVVPAPMAIDLAKIANTIGDEAGELIRAKETGESISFEMSGVKKLRDYLDGNYVPEPLKADLERIASSIEAEIDGIIRVEKVDEMTDMQTYDSVMHQEGVSLCESLAKSDPGLLFSIAPNIKRENLEFYEGFWARFEYFACEEGSAYMPLFIEHKTGIPAPSITCFESFTRGGAVETCTFGVNGIAWTIRFDSMLGDTMSRAPEYDER